MYSVDMLLGIGCQVPLLQPSFSMLSFTVGQVAACVRACVLRGSRQSVELPPSVQACRLSDGSLAEARPPLPDLEPEGVLRARVAGLAAEKQWLLEIARDLLRANVVGQSETRVLELLRAVLDGPDVVGLLVEYRLLAARVGVDRARVARHLACLQCVVVGDREPLALGGDAAVSGDQASRRYWCPAPPR